MTLRTLLFAAAFPLFYGALYRSKVPQDGPSLESYLKNLGRAPGPLGYFSSFYMAFTSEKADEFPNLVSVHSRMRQIKTTRASLQLAENGSLSLQSTSRIRRRTKRDTSYPITTPSDSCESTIGGLKRLCDVCPAITDLGSDKMPRYINEVLCGEEPSCDEGGVVGICQNSTVVQDFLMIDDEGSMQVYSQPIRVCCECGLFP